MNGATPPAGIRVKIDRRFPFCLLLNNPEETDRIFYMTAKLSPFREGTYSLNGIPAKKIRRAVINIEIFK